MMKKTEPFQIRFPVEILKQLKTVAANQHTTSSEIVRRLVIDYLKKQKIKTYQMEFLIRLTFLHLKKNSLCCQANLLKLRV